MVADGYEAELKNLDEQQRVNLAIERLRAQEAVRMHLYDAFMLSLHFIFKYYYFNLLCTHKWT